jgi:hypothetical protein
VKAIVIEKLERRTQVVMHVGVHCYEFFLDPGESIVIGPASPESQWNRCVLCAATGRTGSGKFCECAIGRDLARMDRRAARGFRPPELGDEG